MYNKIIEKLKDRNTITALIIFIPVLCFYLYLVTPVTFGWYNMNFSMRYQPFTSCVVFDINILGMNGQRSECGISPFKYIEVKRRTRNISLDDIYSQFAK